VLSPRRKTLLPILVGTVTFAVFWQTLLPTISAWGDSAKFQYIAQVWGIPHPSGYPLFILLTRAAGWLPWGDIAYRVNLLTAAFGAAAAAALFIAARQITAQSLPSFVATLLAAFSPIFWSQAVAAEVYTFNAFWVALCLALLLHWRTHVINAAPVRVRSLALYAFLFAYAISFSHHLSMVLLAPAFIWLIVTAQPRVVLQRSTWLVAALALLIGLLPYSYIILRAAQGAAYSEFPAIDDRSIWLAFLDYVTGSQFRAGFFAVFTQGPAALGRIIDYLSFMLRQFHWWGIGLAGIGAVHLWRQDRKLFTALGLAFLGETVFPLGYAVIDPDVFFIPSLLILSLFIAAGLAWIEKMLSRRFDQPTESKLTHLLLAAGGIALIVGTLIHTWGTVDQSHNTWGRQWPEAFISGMEDNALVVLPQPYFYSQQQSLLYLKAVEDKVPALEFIDRREIDEWAAHRPIYLSLMLPELKEQYRLTAVDSSQQTLTEFLEALPAGAVVLAAVKDEASIALSDADAQAWKIVGAGASLRGCFRCGHALIGVKGAAPGTAMESIGPETHRLNVGARQLIGETSIPAPKRLSVLSAGFEAGDQAEIWVGRQQVAPNHRGYNIAVLDPETGRILTIAYVDTFESNLVNNVRKYRLEPR
jgi:hypothetical protein